MRTEDIGYVLAIAEEGNVGRAALRLGVSQPALSKSLQRLEDQLGFALFERSAKGMSPTPAATSLMRRLQGVHLQLSDAVREATEIHLGGRGQLSVGIAPMLVDESILRAVTRLREHRPGVHMSMSINLNDVLMRELASGKLDLIICALPPATPEGLQAELLFTDTLCVAASSRHPLAGRRSLRAEDLSPYAWLLPRRGIWIRGEVERALLAAGVAEPRVAIEVSVYSITLLQLVRDSDLLAVVTENGLSGHPEAGLRALDTCAQLRWSRKLGLMTREGAYTPPLALRFLELLREERGVQGSA